METLPLYPHDPDFPKKMTNMGLFGYSPEQIINMLDVPEDQEKRFMNEFKNPQSQIAKAYQRGCDKRMFQFESNLYTLANKGNLGAQKELEARIKARERENAKDK